MRKKALMLGIVTLCCSLVAAGGLWAGANFSMVKTQATGGTILAADWNAEFANILNNLTPAGVDDESTNEAAMQATADPYPGSVASLPTSLQGEIQRLRYLIAQITGETYWYIDPDTTIAALNTLLSGVTFTAFTKTLLDDADAAAARTTLGVGYQPLGFSKLALSTTGANATITVTADKVAVLDTSTGAKTLSAVSLSINSAASGANGLDTGSLAATTWYSVWVIYNPTTDTAAGLISASATTPTMPADYTYKARVGWIRTDGSGNKYPLSIKQVGNKVQYVVASGGNVTRLPLMASGAKGTYHASTPTWEAVATGNFVPSTAGSIIVLASCVYNGGSGSNLIVAPNNQYGGYTSTNPPPVQLSGNYEWGVQSSMILESSNIYTASGNTGAALQCVGWEDNL